MNIENGDGESSLAGVSAAAEANAQVSSPETNPQDPLKNLKAEMNRKMNKVNERLEKVLAYIEKGPTSPSVEKTEEFPIDNDVKTYVDARLTAVREEEAVVTHQKHWQDALATFPELNQNSDSFDDGFYKMVDKYYTRFKQSDPTDPNALKDALEFAANRSGKAEQMFKAKLLQDEARRSRIISEGGSTPREQKKEKEVSLNESNLARLGINPDKLRQRIKSNKDKYGLES